MSKILFLPRENKIHIFSPPCNILYICHLWLAGHVLIEVEVDHINGQTFFTLFEQESGLASPSN